MPPPVKPAPAPSAILHRLAAFLGARRDGLMDTWKAALRQNLRAGRVPVVDDRGLIDHLPRLFDDLVAGLRGDETSPEKITEDARRHGQARWDQQYSLGEVLQELGIVSRLLLEHGLDAFADAHAGMDREALRPARETILGFFEDTACGSVRQYVSRQQEQTDAAHQEGRREERRQAATVRGDYERLADIFQSSPSFLAMLRGPDHVFHLVNDQYRRITGHRALAGKPVREALPEVVAQGYIGVLDQVYASGEPFVGKDVRILLQNEQDAPPKEHFIDFVYLPTRDIDGHVNGIVVHGVDWTERKRAQQAAGELSEQRRLALDSARMGWWHYDPATGMVDWDQRARELYNMDSAHLAFEQVMAAVHPDDLPARDAAFQASILPGNPGSQYETEYRVKGADGTWRWLQVRGKAAFTGEGAERRVTSVDGTVADVTPARAAQQVLLESEEKFRQLADSMPQIVWAARPDGVLDYTNRRWYEYIQKSEAEWDVANWGECVHPDDLPGAAVVWQNSIASGDPYTTEFRVQGGDGEYRWFLVRALAIRDDEGRITRWFGTCTDVQDQRALMEQNSVLLESERTARTQIERTSHMKDEFLATLSHELRTPLNAILGWTQVLRGDPGNAADVDAGLATIERNAHAQTQIIEDLLDMSKIISGKVRLDVQPLHLDQVVAAVIETMRPAATAKNIRLQTLIDPQARMISGDPNRLQQVFWNLLSNAIKFTPKGGQTQVVLERVHSHLEVSVADTGEGIDPEFLPYVFDRFRQQDASTTRRHGGLGLGLAIVKQLVELHGGSISVKSAGLGHGTTFGVLLPLSVVQPAPEQADPERRHPQGEAAPLSVPSELLDLTGVKVLVVDDESDARTLVKRLLEDRKAIVTTAASAAEALMVLQAERPDVLVSDIGMPEEDGYSLVRRVRALPPHEGGNTPAIALTAYARAEDRLKAVFAGFQMHVSKPVNAVELLALVANLAGRTGSF